MTKRPLASIRDTQELAEKCSRVIKPGMTVGLIGPLGAGKTTFVKFLVAALRGDPKQVASPSFTLQYEYGLDRGDVVEHWDLYRLRDAPPELREPAAVGTIRLIEWADRSSDLLADTDLTLAFEVDDEANRFYTLGGRLSSSLESLL